MANVNCNGCGKALCPSCDHRIKGFPYCQDCIVAGVELLRNKHQAFYVPIVKRQTSPFIAALLSVCPGLGAAYNGQTSKALVHFLATVGLFQMAILSGGMAIFVLGFFGMWVFTGLDAWRTAQMIRSGVTSEDAQDVLIQRFNGNAGLWGVVLTVIGVSFVLSTFFNIQLLVNFILPALLIGLGMYLLRQMLTRPGSGFRRAGGFGGLLMKRAGNNFDDVGDGPGSFEAGTGYRNAGSRRWKDR
ncbi:MAG: hypothetical protein DWQ47_06800 [Acidobacteria bacterium]|nr:MAG: hypothetical protein DWQ32_10350 [Acidobacteriota bacterium]REK02081.1 MAG: hypothetical protein DWQ38_06780 [Acidobacteriota bacterium]REK15039.1 MAG: hypothetical protein DWQ43_16040 [Acidobacteriota bacterium]REK45753.1 MAG: hypothetical protein DWQ47_06800 [Acidobacteriota bacterium]